MSIPAIRLTIVALLGWCHAVTAHAQPEHTVTLDLQELETKYTETGKRCEVRLNSSGSSEFQRMVYSLEIAGGQHNLCTYTKYANGGYTGPYCNSTDEIPSCAALTNAKLHSITCYEDEERPVACGEVALQSAGASFVAGARLSDPADTEIIIAQIKDEDDGEGCDEAIGFAFAPELPFVGVAFSYVAIVGDEEAKSCTGSWSDSGGGSSCTKILSDYSCADVQRYDMYDLTCRDTESEEHGCKKVSFTGVGAASVGFPDD